MNLKTAFEPYFKVGAAISRWNLHKEANRKLLLAQLNSFTCENDMKPMFFLDTKENKADPAKYNLSPALTFEVARPYLEFAKENGIAMRGHTLAWHNQTPKWFFCEDYNELRPLADRETMLARLENYIKGVLGFVQTEYPGVIYAWDVFNEIVDEGDFRKTLWLQTIGKDYFIKAFEFARRYADQDVALFYNDYETSLEWKRDFIIKEVLKPLMEKGLVDGMGLQSHLLMDLPDPEVYREALEMYGALGLQIQITELDMHNADPSESSMKALADRYRQFFEIYVEAKKSGKANITSVTFWNLLDEDSWLTGFRRETSYPLLFREKSMAKEAYYEVLKTAVSEDQIDKWEPDYADDEYKLVGLKMPEVLMFSEEIWEEGEYTYEAAYGFVPNLHAYLHPDEKARDCMLIVPGGGYCMCVPHEGELPAMEFYKQGMNVFVLAYTTDITMSIPLKDQPLKDIARAVRSIRKQAKEHNRELKKLVICGFSAGAHVCGSLAVHYADVKEQNPKYAEFSDRPDGVILSYPVITTGEFTHADSIRALLGEKPDEKELEYYSLEKQVTGQTPPCLLWQTQVDELVPVENSYLFAMALRKQKVPFAHYVFPTGFHGLSIANEAFFRGWSPEHEYTMEQTMRAAYAVKEGKGVKVSEKRREELIQQFFGDNEPMTFELDQSLREDVGRWGELAMAWIRRL